MLLAAIELINFDPIFQKLNSKKKKKKTTAKPNTYLLARSTSLIYLSASHSWSLKMLTEMFKNL